MDDLLGGQLEMQFGAASDERGHDRWQKRRCQALRKFTRKLGLPLNHSAEVWLKDGIRLRGVLKLKEELLFVSEQRDLSLELKVDGVAFIAADITSWVRWD